MIPTRFYFLKDNHRQSGVGFQPAYCVLSQAGTILRNRLNQRLSDELSNDVVDDVAMNISKAEIATGVTIRQLGMIES
jgi:tRNA A37 N6-isopentenylltransferase MiaA